MPLSPRPNTNSGQTILPTHNVQSWHTPNRSFQIRSDTILEFSGIGPYLLLPPPTRTDHKFPTVVVRQFDIPISLDRLVKSGVVKVLTIDFVQVSFISDRNRSAIFLTRIIHKVFRGPTDRVSMTIIRNSKTGISCIPSCPSGSSAHLTSPLPSYIKIRSLPISASKESNRRRSSTDTPCKHAVSCSSYGG